MFHLDRPSMAVNDPRVCVGNYIRRFQMQFTWDIAAGEDRQHIIDHVAWVARNKAGGRFRNLVLSCHGFPAYLQLGQGFDMHHIQMFFRWRGLVDKIWLPDCLVARIPDNALQAQFPGVHFGDGHRFCSILAKGAQCYLVVPTEVQVDYCITEPEDQMTSFEGLVLCYGPNGDITWQGRNPSSWIDSGGTWHGMPD